MLTGHARVDARSLAVHRAIAEKLRAQPGLIEVARENLRGWMADVLAAVEEDSERMTALRQCTPFAGVLTLKERWGIYDAFAAW